MAESIVKLRVDASSATSALKSVQNQTNKLQQSFGGLKTAIAGLGIGLLARQAINTSANFEKLNVRLGLLTKSSGTFAKSQKVAADAQKAFGLSATEALEGITDITARLAPLGVGVDDIKSTFFGFNTAAKLAGASAIESSNAFRQLAQALGSGRLQGDEFRSISEQIPTLLAPIAAELNTNVGALKKFASEGKLTSDVVLRALRKIETEGSASLKELIKNDPTQVFKNLTNATEDLARAIGGKLRPAVEPTVKALTALTLAITNFLNTSEGQTALVISGIVLAVKGLSVVIPVAVIQIKALIAGFSMVGVQSIIVSGGLTGVNAASLLAAGGISKLTVAVGALTIAAKALPLVALAGGFAFLTNAIIKAINKQKEFNKLLEEGSSTDIQNEIDKITKSIEKLQSKKDKVDGSMINIFTVDEEIKLKGLLKDLDKLKEKLVIAQGIELFRDFEKAKNALEEKNKKLKESVERSKIATEEGRKQFDIENRRQELIKKYGEELAEIILKLEEENRELDESAKKIKKKGEEAEKLKEKFAAIGQEIEQNIKDELREAIKGAKSFGDAMNAVLNKIQDKLIDLAIDDLFSGINKKDKGGGIGGFIGSVLGGIFGGEKALGGPVSRNKAFLVGERGPEMFMPNSAGTIIPNNKLGGGDSITNIVNVSVDASGSSVEGDDALSQQLGQTIALVVQETLVREKRNGGLLA